MSEGPVELLTKEQVMAELGISHKTYWTYVKRYPTQFKTARIGKRRWMRRENLEKFIEYRERTT